MNRKQARLIALRLAYEAVQKAVDAGGKEAGVDVEAQKKIDAELDRIAQQMFDKWQRQGEKL